MGRLIVADASWVIALRDPDDRHHDDARRINAELGDEPVVLAAVTFTECLVAAAQLGVLHDAETRLRAAFDIVAVDDDAPARWAARRAVSGLRLPDAIVLDTAIHEHARGVATFDERLAAAVASAGLEPLR